MSKEVKMWTRAELTRTGKRKMSEVVEFESGVRVEIPINRDGSIKWFDDTKLIKENRHGKI